MARQGFKIQKPFFVFIKFSSVFSICLIGALLLSISKPNSVEAAAGDLDPTFGDGGRVFTSFGPSAFNGICNKVIIQPDGKILAAGEVGSFSTGSDFGIARYNQNGTPDMSFGFMGNTITPFSNASDEILSLAVQSDGKIVAAGTTTGFGLNNDFALTRYQANGTIDSSFGINGKVSTDFFGNIDLANDVAIQSDGKIVVAGYAFGTMQDVLFTVVRYNADGSLDNSFGQGGKFILPSQGFAFSVVIDHNGKIVVAGMAASTPLGIHSYCVVRFNATGTLDTSFDGDGIVYTDFPFGVDVRALLLLPEGKLLVAGDTYNFGEPRFPTVVCYNPDGSLDQSFGTQGIAITPIGNSQLFSAALQKNGKFVVSLIPIPTSQATDFTLLRFNPNGSLDQSFGNNGQVNTDFLGGTDLSRTVAIQQDGRIIAGGFSVNNTSPTRQSFVLAGYQGDPVNFDLCVQDDSSRNTLQINLTTGEYQFTQCNGITLNGTGILSKRGCTITLQHNATDRRLLAKIDSCLNKGSATVQRLSPYTFFTLTDKNMANNSCSCE
jgi:uncharacterized delta-60 repeat protein